METFLYTSMSFKQKYHLDCCDVELSVSVTVVHFYSACKTKLLLFLIYII
jgi:hypothetical protein